MGRWCGAISGVAPHMAPRCSLACCSGSMAGSLSVLLAIYVIFCYCWLLDIKLLVRHASRRLRRHGSRRNKNLEQEPKSPPRPLFAPLSSCSSVFSVSPVAFCFVLVLSFWRYNHCYNCCLCNLRILELNHANQKSKEQEYHYV